MLVLILWGILMNCSRGWVIGPHRQQWSNSNWYGYLSPTCTLIQRTFSITTWKLLGDSWLVHPQLTQSECVFIQKGNSLWQNLDNILSCINTVWSHEMSDKSTWCQWKVILLKTRRNQHENRHITDDWSVHKLIVRQMLTTVPSSERKI